MFRDYYAKLHIWYRFMLIKYPQSNNKVEVINQIILQGLRIKLEESKGKWVEKLPEILWAYHITLRTSINETPFNLAFDIKAVIPVKIKFLTMDIEHFDEASNLNQLRVNLDLLEETHNQTHL